MVNRLEIDFYKELHLPKPMVCGLVSKITSPKGMRKLNERDQYEYRLKNELVQVYYDKPASVEPGLYWVMDIFKRENDLTWNHYLIIVEDDCFYPVAEFVECTDSHWIKGALPYIKAYFAGEELDPVELTRYRVPKKTSRWGRTK